MTAKEYLNRIRRQNFILKQTKHELTEIRSDILTIRASSLAEHVSGSKNSDVADKYIRLEQYMDKVNHEWDILINMRMEAKAMIKALPDPQQQAVLYARYINCKRWEDIASDMGYSWQGVFKLHGRALQSFEHMNKMLLCKE
jgi:DNA-directed RNA polymerase specialized sigma subunit|nr:MAG TPA: Protein of unknown function (DUF1492) [Caudoviricetes sp.]